MKKESNEQNPTALNALKELMQVQSQVVFPILLPTLLCTPLSSFNAKALASLVRVSGSMTSKRLDSILPILITSLNQKDEALPDIQDALCVLLAHVQGPEAVHYVMTTLLETIKSNEYKLYAYTTLEYFYKENSSDFSSYNGDWVSHLISLMSGKDPSLLVPALSCLDALVKRVKKEELDKLVPDAYKGVQEACRYLDSKEVVPGFSLDKGLSPILPIFLQGLLYGNPDIRTSSAYALGDLVDRTRLESLKPFTTQITGPLIRVVGDRFTSNVKAAILQTLRYDLLHLSKFIKL